MKTILLFIVVCAFKLALAQQYLGPIPKISSGYGKDGTHSIGVIKFPNPHYSGKDIEVYYPSDINTSVPTIFYSHAYGATSPGIVQGLLDWVAKKGYAIVFVPYKTIGSSVSERYDNLLNGFRKAARDHSNIIDTTRVGFLGWSFGGGASFGNAYKCFTENNWGSNGRFIYAQAQWYSYNISQNELQSFPGDVKVLIQVFDDDPTNDHRMAADIFNTINIPLSEKDYILVRSDTISGYVYDCIHNVPNTSTAFDALDYYAHYRLLDALCDYTFTGNSVGKDVALGNGSNNQISMPGGMKNLEQTDNPVIYYPESKYTFPCGDNQNPRKAYCVNINTSEPEIPLSQHSVKLYPNPFFESTTISIDNWSSNQNWNFNIVDLMGNVVYRKKIDASEVTITPDLAEAVYFLELKGNDKSVKEKIVVLK